MMYYQYDGRRTVTELTNRHGETIEHYRYDAFGNIYTGITAPYNVVSYTGHEYDAKAGLVYMNARWYNSPIGRFTSEDTYPGNMYTPQSLNRYTYVMNDPVNLWDPTGNVPDWVREKRNHIEFYPSGSKYAGEVMYGYYYQEYLLNYGKDELTKKLEYNDKIVYEYTQVISEYWSYKRVYCFDYYEGIDEYGHPYKDHKTEEDYITYQYHDDDIRIVVVKAIDIANKNQKEICKLIREMDVEHPENSDNPVRFDIIAKYTLENENKPNKPIISKTPLPIFRNKQDAAIKTPGFADLNTYKKRDITSSITSVLSGSLMTYVGITTAIAGATALTIATGGAGLPALIATITVAGTVAAGAGVAAFGVNEVIYGVTDYNPLLDKVFKDNTEAYVDIQLMLSMGAYAGATYSSAYTYQENVFRSAFASEGAGEAKLSTKDINFMQSSIKNTTGEYTVLGNADALKSGTLKPSDLPAIKVWKDAQGKIWTLDHRRLAAFKLGGVEEIPIEWASKSLVESQMWKMTTKTGGTSIKLKLGNGESIIVK